MRKITMTMYVEDWQGQTGATEPLEQTEGIYHVSVVEDVETDWEPDY